MNLKSQTTISPVMIHIPAGAFSMGTSNSQVEKLVEKFEIARRWKDKGYFSREQPVHQINLPDYSISKDPITVGEYRNFILQDGYAHKHYWTQSGWLWRRSHQINLPKYWEELPWCSPDDLPVVGVSWYEAHAYCSWLRDVSGQPFRLPNEGEWEKAARGEDGRTFPWGEDFDIAFCNTRLSALDRTIPVGSYSPGGDSPYGCVDMVGNVSEWTSSVFKVYPFDHHDGRQDPGGEMVRATRGGSWFSVVLRARTSSRGLNDPFFRDHDLGFRVAIDECS